MDPQLAEFIETVVNSPLKLDLVLFFFHNQQTVDTAVDIGRRTGRNAGEVSQALEDLCRSKVLSKQETGDEPAFGYTQDGYIAGRVEQLSRYCNHDHRYEILTQIYEGQARSHLTQLVELRQRETLKTQFVSMVSHELRTPLTTIKAAADTLHRLDGQLPAEQRLEFLTQVSQQTDRLITIVNDLLMLSERAGLDEVTVAPPDRVDLPSFIRRIVGSWRSKSEAHVMDWQPFEEVPLVFAEPARLQIALEKLIENAEKFSPEGGVIELSLVEHPEEVEVRVKDSGIGIAPEHLGRIFDEFYQVEYYATRRAGGCGLGLYISRKLVEAMGGRISVQSRLGEGSVFSVFLPKARDRTPSHPIPPSQ